MVAAICTIRLVPGLIKSVLLTPNTKVLIVQVPAMSWMIVPALAVNLTALALRDTARAQHA